MTALALAAGGFGLGVGFLAGCGSAAVSRRLGGDDFWRPFMEIVRRLLFGDEHREFLRHYLQMWQMLSRLVLNKFAALLAVVPLVAAAFFAMSVLADHASHSSTTLAASAPPPELALLCHWELWFFASIAAASPLGALAVRRFA